MCDCECGCEWWAFIRSQVMFVQAIKSSQDTQMALQYNTIVPFNVIWLANVPEEYVMRKRHNTFLTLAFYPHLWSPLSSGGDVIVVSLNVVRESVLYFGLDGYFEFQLLHVICCLPLRFLFDVASVSRLRTLPYLPGLHNMISRW